MCAIYWDNLAQYRRQPCVARLPTGTRGKRKAALAHGAYCAESHYFAWMGCAVGQEIIENSLEM